MAKWGDLTPGTIHQIAGEVRDGEADPDDARRLLELFCECRQSVIPPRLIEHLQDAFAEYLSGRKTLEFSLGLARKRGRPKADEQTRQEMVADLLRYRLEGMTHQESLAVISGKYGWGDTVIGEAWAAHKHDALILLRLERAVQKYPWAPDEVQRLAEIFRDDPAFIAPGKPPIKPA